MKKRSNLILTAGPSITEKEISYVNDAVTNGWNDQWNKYIIKFEESLFFVTDFILDLKFFCR